MVAHEAALERAPGVGAMLAAMSAALLVGLSCNDTPSPSSLGVQSREAGAGGTASTLSANDVVNAGTGGQTSPGTSGEVPVAHCQASENYGPGEPGRHASCHFEGEERTRWSLGDPTPPGLYRCDCTDGSASVPDASDCDDALRRGCNVDFATLPPDPCSDPDDVAHLCWPVRGNPNEWSCRCAAWDPIGVTRSTSCGEAVAQYCGRCASERGSCVQSSGPRQVQYQPEFDCSCVSGGAGQADAGGLDASSPAAGGANVQHIGLDAFGDCSLALALSCGYPAAGARCELPDPAGGALACSADGEGHWSCDCPRFDECWARSHPVDACAPGDLTCVHSDMPPPGLDRPRVCEGAIYEYCQCPEP